MNNIWLITMQVISLIGVVVSVVCASIVLIKEAFKKGK
jgi:hypothetical protein